MLMLKYRPHTTWAKPWGGADPDEKILNPAKMVQNGAKRGA